jgi:wingless-type MMTV integration site family, member 6
VCNKPKRLKGKLAEICEKKGTLLKVIERGINMGYNECEAQFKHRPWNCTKLKKSMKKILLNGK